MTGNVERPKIIGHEQSFADSLRDIHSKIHTAVAEANARGGARLTNYRSTKFWEREVSAGDGVRPVKILLVDYHFGEPGVHTSIRLSQRVEYSILGTDGKKKSLPKLMCQASKAANYPILELVIQGKLAHNQPANLKAKEYKRGLWGGIWGGRKITSQAELEPWARLLNVIIKDSPLTLEDIPKSLLESAKVEIGKTS